MTKHQEWLQIRDKSTSDTQADRKYELTDNGKLEKVYRQQLKTCEKMMSAIKTRIEIMIVEARNQYCLPGLFCYLPASLGFITLNVT